MTQSNGNWCLGVVNPCHAFFGNEYRCYLLNWVTGIIQRENSASLQNVERFVHPQVPVDRYAPPTRHLLGA